MKMDIGMEPGLTTQAKGKKEKNPMVLKKLAKDCRISLIEMKEVTGATGVSITACLDYSKIPAFPSDFCETLEVYLIKNPMVVDWLAIWEMKITDIWMPQFPNHLSDSCDMMKSSPPILKQLISDCRLELKDLALGSGMPLELIARYLNEGIYDVRLSEFCDWAEKNLQFNDLVMYWLSARALNIEDIWNPLSAAINNKLAAATDPKAMGAFEAQDVVSDAIAMVTFMDQVLSDRLSEGHEMTKSHGDLFAHGMSLFFEHIQDHLSRVQGYLSETLT